MAAGIEYIIDAREVDRVLADRLAKFPGVLRRLEQRTAIFIADTAKEGAAVDRGEMRAKIAIVKKRDSIAVESQAPYSLHVERGTRAHTPPFAPIERWALRHGLPPGAVWQGIRRRGTKAQPFFEPAVKSGTKMFKRWAEEALRSWAG